MNDKTAADNAGDANEGEKAKGAPRARKWNYGIVADAKVVRQKEDGEVNVKRDVQDQWAHTAPNGKNPKTVQEFYDAGGDRHGLRVLSRRGLIKIVHADGTEYPQPFDPANPPKTEGSRSSKSKAPAEDTKAPPKKRGGSAKGAAAS